MNKFHYFITSSILLAGCVSFPDKGMIHFQNSNDLRKLEGIYENKGDPKGYMSQKIPGFTPMYSNNANPELNNKYIEARFIKYIVVKVTNETVVVQAIKDGCIAYERKYINNIDFIIENGKIVLENDFNLLTRGGGDLLVGPTYFRTVIGIDTSGDAAYHNSGAAAGLVVLFIPIAIAGIDEIRFNKVIMESGFNFTQCLE